MRRYLIAFVLVASATQAHDPFMDAYAFYELGQQTGGMVTAATTVTSLAEDIDRARDAYWGCGSCPEQQALLEVYMDQLGAKDVRYLLKALVGYDGVAGGFDTGISGPMKVGFEMLGVIDGGIHSECRDDFGEWVWMVGSRTDGTADGLIRAIQNSGEKYTPYLKCRNEGEVDRTPVYVREIDDARMYVIASYAVSKGRRSYGEQKIEEARAALGDEMVQAVLDAVWAAAEMEPGEWHEVIRKNRAVGCGSYSARGCFSNMILALEAGKQLYREPDPDIPVSPLLADVFTDDPAEDYVTWVSDETIRKNDAEAMAVQARIEAAEAEAAAARRVPEQGNLDERLAAGRESEAPRTVIAPEPMAATAPTPAVTNAPAARSEAAAPAVKSGSNRVYVTMEDVKRQWAPSAAQYQAVAEFCAGQAMPELRADFLAAVEEKFPEQSGEVEADYQEAYDTRRAKVDKKNKCPNATLGRTRKKYNNAMNVLRK
jgi:hypothetical protein